MNSGLNLSQYCLNMISSQLIMQVTVLFVLTAAPLVKPIPFQACDPSVAGPDIFQRLIPMEAHTDSSLYRSEMILLSTLLQLYMYLSNICAKEYKKRNMVNL